MSDHIYINGRKIGAGEPVYVIAEMSANHNGDLKRALDIVRAAKDSGADAIKLQFYTPDTMTLDLDTPPFQANGLWEGETLYELYTRAMTPVEWIDPIRNLAAALKIDCFASVFSEEAVDIAIERLHAPALKIASFENVHFRLLNYAAMKAGGDIPIILSTGMATREDLDMAMAALWSGHPEAGGALLKCNSGYPTPLEDVNLATIRDLQAWFPGPVGYSDHTPYLYTSAFAVAAGAQIIEKHLKLDKEDCPDGAFSMTPFQFREMTTKIRAARKAIGEPFYGPTESEKPSMAFRRSVFAVEGIAKGEQFNMENIAVIRPGTGLHPQYYDWLLGQKAGQDIPAGTPMSLDLLYSPHAEQNGEAAEVHGGGASTEA